MSGQRFFVWLLLAAFCLPCRAHAGGQGAGMEAWSRLEEREAEPTAADKVVGFWSERIDVTGWIELLQSVRTHAPHDEVTSRAHGRLEMKGDFNWLYGFLSMDAEKNWTIPSEDGFSVREAWLEHVGDGWDLRLGRQLIIWGKADGVRITDNICPTDFTEYLNREIDEMRIPVTAAKLRIMSDTLITELIWIPEFKPAKLASGDNPWAVDYTAAFPMPVRWRGAKEPSSYSLKDSEFAAKVSSYMAGFDVSLSAFYTWDDNAANYYSMRAGATGMEMVLEPEYHRIMIYGLDFAKPWSDFVFRGEAAYFQGRRLSVDDGQPAKHDVLKSLLGVDWSPGGNWTITAQVLDDWVVDYRRNLTCEEHTPQATLNVSKTFFNELLTVSDMIYYSMNDGEYFNRLQFSYELGEGLELTVGWDKFQGDDGSYGVYKRNSQVWGKIRYSF